MAYPESYNLFAIQKQNGYPNANTAPVTAEEAKGQPNIVHSTPVVPPSNFQPQAQQAQNNNSVTYKVNPNSSTDGMDLLSSMYTSPEQEEKYRKAAVANQRILAVADALRHIGNIYNTVNYAPAQQLNTPVQEEADRYLKGKALRDAANMRYLSYQQQKANQEARIRQAEAQLKYNMEKDAANAKALKEYRDSQLKANEDRWKTQLAAKEKNDEANRKMRQQQYDKQNEFTKQRIGISAANARNAESHRQWIRENKGKGGGSGVAPLDTPRGQITPNGRSYSNQLLQMFDYAKSKGLVKETDVAKRLREMGFGKDQSDNVKRQMVMDLLRSNQDLGDYAANRLGWTYGGGSTASSWDEYLEDEEDWSQYED